MNKAMIKLILLLAGVGLFHLETYAQQRKPGAPSTGIVLPLKRGTVAASLAGRALSKSDAVQHLGDMLNLSAKHSFKQVLETTDALGFTHIRFQQYYQNVKVEGANILIHVKDGLVTFINGNVGTIETLAMQPVLRAGEAFINAKKLTQVKKVLREYPIELVMAAVPTSTPDKDYLLAYKVRIDGKAANGKIIMVEAFINATNGKIINIVNLMADVDVTGTANTLYSGSRAFTIDSIAPGNFRLRDSGRHIQTYNGFGVIEVPSVSTGLDKDFVNGTRDWNLFNTFSSTTLLTASTALTTGGQDNQLLFDLVNGSGVIGFESIFLGKRVNTQLPGITSGLYNILDPASTFTGIYFNINAPTFTLVDSTKYTVTNFNVGTHSWSDTFGNSGNYTISLEKNPAVDAHWGMQKTVDFYRTLFGRNSYDNNGSVIRNYVNSGLSDNAGAVPDPYNYMVYGMGNGTTLAPLVSVDVLGHEYTHLVTGHNGNGGLTYQGESGALNESFSDIFGACIEAYTNGISPATWTIGEGVILINPGYLRSLSTPKTGRTKQPDTYKGQYWASTEPDSMDNGGVHINSGIQNKWFYLLAQGGTGINDKGDAYNVTAIGMDKAQKITYRNLTTYLLPESQYIDAYNGSLQATKDLFGSDTTKPEYKAVREAWYAVGIGTKSTTTSVNEIALGNGDLKLYPNPATNKVTISSNLSQVLDAQIINVAGVPVMNITVSKGLNPIDISTLAKGVYMIRYNTGVKGYVQKLSVL